MEFLIETIMKKNVFGESSPFCQVSKFGLVGILNTIVGYGVFIFLLGYTNYIASLVLSHLIGVTHSFIWNKFWIFKSNAIKLDEFVKFNSIYAGVFIINAVVLILSVNVFSLDPRISQLIALPVITLVSFAGHKYWSFGNKKH
ncbi:GtrA-like protein [uncultured archaeon]|nr:GtrA-like protein [uncultured archaeon]